jgi:serine/threonine protein phosphatase PrpC
VVDIALDNGTTATVCYMRVEGADKVLYTGNVGDSNSYLIMSETTRLTTVVHTARERSEVGRVMKAGGKIRNRRVAGALTVTRAIGDYALKNDGIICTPSVERHVLGPDDRYLIIASDGLWDTVKSTDLNQGALSGSVMDIANGMMALTMERNTNDNIAIIVVAF